MRFIILFFLLLSISKLQAEIYQAGLILPNDEKASSYPSLYLPAYGLNIYEKPLKSHQIGCLSIETGEQGSSNVSAVYIETKSELKRVAFGKLEEVDYEVYVLPFSATNNGFVKVLDSLWVEIAELEKIGYKNASWMEYLTQSGGNVLGYFAKEPGLNLRKGASTEFEKIVTIFGERMMIKLTPEVKELWNKILVTEYDNEPCGDQQTVINQYEGWVKLLDDSGTPNIWWYSRGC